MSAEISILTLTLGVVETNAYIVGDRASGQAVLIDPVDDAPLLVQTAADAGFEIALILATHAHFDHVLASAALKQLTGAPFALHTEAEPMLRGLPEQGRMFFGSLLPPAAEPDRLITSEDEVIELGAIWLHPLYTPGHAPGHLAFFMPSQQLVFSGDALFAGSIGRTDLPGGSMPLLLDSIRQKLLTLDDDVRVLPGHGQPTTIGIERRENPYLQW
ncbi:MAG TPA: MBL fold metallo-hydrolase [Candidatus Limnocylindrales bacterium]|nr:MBL fold metallo-hydrolase [Candidatus Limnocylindrales bacterium]